MINFRLLQFPLFLTIFLFIAITTTPAIASVKYTFVVSEEPTDAFFKPLFAEITLSNAAVSAGTATKGQIESVVFGGGSTMEEENRITLAYLHGDFIDLTATLSADRKTITNISATLKTSSSSIDSWVFHYQNPTHPTLNLHEFVGNITKQTVSLETTILPIPPTHHFATFKGEWKRQRQCWFFSRILCRPIYFLPLCWIDIILAGTAILVLSVVTVSLLRKTKRS